MRPKRTARCITAVARAVSVDVGCFSFYANKIITTGEGGMVITDDARLAERARSLRNLCFRRDRRFLHTELGHNYRMTNLQAAIGLAQVERVEEHLRLKRRMGALYTERLRSVQGIALPVERPGVTNVYWMYGIVLDDAAEMRRRSSSRGACADAASTRDRSSSACTSSRCFTSAGCSSTSAIR